VVSAFFRQRNFVGVVGNNLSSNGLRRQRPMDLEASCPEE
jgi:hypothetical protein